MTLCAVVGATIEIEAAGEDEVEALRAVETGFGLDAGTTEGAEH